MKRAIGGLLVAAAMAASGCGEQAPPPSSPAQKLATSIHPREVNPTAARQDSFRDDRVIARANGQAITMGQFLQPLIESRGLPLLLNLVQLELAKQDARNAHVIVSSADVDNEQELTLSHLFKDADQKELDQLDAAGRKGDAATALRLREQIHKDREQLLAQYLQDKSYSRKEYDLVVAINAYLRKIAEPMIQGRITDEMVQKEFGIEYGETAQVRYLQLANMQEVAEARRRLKEGEDFSEVARSMSRNARSAALGGEMPAFSRQTPGIPDSFKQLAFSMLPGQISDTLNVNGSYYILKLMQKFAPKAVKFDSVKEALRKSMYERVIQATVEDLRTSLGEQAMNQLVIEEPTLGRQFDDLKARREAAIRDRQRINEQLRKERELHSPTTEPATTTAPASAATAPAPTTAPATQP